MADSGEELSTTDSSSVCEDLVSELARCNRKRRAIKPSTLPRTHTHAHLHAHAHMRARAHTTNDTSSVQRLDLQFCTSGIDMFSDRCICSVRTNVKAF